MAGFTENTVTGEKYEFSIYTPNASSRISQVNNVASTVTLKLNGEELKAALWGFKNYKKAKN